jgi:putative heme-binding domain-containing protein
VRKRLTAAAETEEVRLRALSALIAAGDAGVLDTVGTVLADAKTNAAAFRAQVLDSPRVGHIVLTHYEKMESDLQPRAIEVLTQRPGWSKQLLRAIAEKKVPRHALNVNQVRRLLASKDAELVKQVTAHWGRLRDGRNPERELVVGEMRTLRGKERGDPMAGKAVFKNVCGQCHKLHGEGVEVGPDLTGNGRASFEQLLSNTFDPSLVIGPAYQATTVTTTTGRLLTGLLVEDSPQRVVLKTQGDKLETIPRPEIEEISLSNVSLMPEGLEKQLKPQEIVDLFAYLVLDRPPDDPAAKKIPGSP